MRGKFWGVSLPYTGCVTRSVVATCSLAKCHRNRFTGFSCLPPMVLFCFVIITWVVMIPSPGLLSSEALGSKVWFELSPDHLYRHIMVVEGQCVECRSVLNPSGSDVRLKWKGGSSMMVAWERYIYPEYLFIVLTLLCVCGGNLTVLHNFWREDGITEVVNVWPVL